LLAFPAIGATHLLTSLLAFIALGDVAQRNASDLVQVAKDRRRGWQLRSGKSHFCQGQATKLAEDATATDAQRVPMRPASFHQTASRGKRASACWR